MKNTRPCSSSAPKRAMSASLRRLVSRRALPALAAAALLTLGAHPASAITYVYTGGSGDPNNPTGGFFSTGFNPTIVSSGTTPVSTTSDTLSFNNNASTYTAADDLTGPVPLNQLLFQNAPGVTTGGAITISGTSSNTLSFGVSSGGSAPSITNNSSAPVTITVPYTATTGTVSAPSLSFNGTGTVTLSPTALPALGGFVSISNGGTVTTNNLAATDPFGSAAIVFNGGTLSLGASATNYTNSYVINGTNTVALAGANVLDNSANTGTITGAGTLNIAGTGTALVTLGGNMSTFSGTIALVPVLVSGVLTPSSSVLRLNNSLNTSGVNSNTGSVSATFDLGQGTAALANRNGSSLSNGTPINFDLGNLLGGPTTQLRGAQSAAIASVYSIGAAATSSAFNDNFQGSIVTGTNSASSTTAIIKTGVGSLTLSNNNSTYTGGTTVSQGNLILQNVTGTVTATTSVTGSGPVAVSGGAGAALSGTGISIGALTVTNNSVLAPGANTAGTNFGTAGGTLTVGQTGGASLTTATLDYDLSSDPAGATTPNDLIATGAAPSLGALSFTFNELNGALATGTPYTLISSTSSPTLQGGASTTNFANNTTFSGGPFYTPAYNLTSTGLTVTFAAAPEPGQTATLSLIALGLGGLFLRARKRKAAQAADA